jgi:hypothetical protein
MRILLISAASLAALSVVPATAQSYSPGYSGNAYGSSSRPAVPTPWQIRSMIDSAERRGEISDDQASNLRQQADDLVRLDRRAQRDDDGDVRRDLNRRTFALLRGLRDARGDSGTDYAYRGRGTGYPPAYRSTPQGGYDSARPAPGDDDDQDQPYTAAPNDAYRAAPRANDQYRTPPSYDPNRAAPQNYNSYRAAPAPNDDQGYDDPNGQDEDNMPPPDDGIYQPRN